MRECYPRLVLLLVTLCVAAGCGRSGEIESTPEIAREIQRVVVIHLDTTRVDALSCYGGIGRTPNIDRVAAGGMRFTNSVVPISLTSASIASFMTGRLAHRNGVYNNGQGLNERFTTLAEVLREHGYATGGFSSNMILANRANGDVSGYGQGFDRFESVLDPIEIAAGADNHRVPRENSKYLTKAALAFIDDHADEPFFLWMLYVDPHAPYAPVPPYDTVFADEPLIRAQDTPLPLDGEWVSKQAVVQGEPNSAYYLQRYFGEVAMVDAWVGTLIDRLETLEGRTLLVITADHGESLGDYGIWFQHGNTIRHSCANVPLVIACEGRVPAGVSHALTANIDLAPTILSLVGIDPEVLDADGQSLEPAFAAGDPWPGRMLPFQTARGEPWRGIRSRDYCLQTLLSNEGASPQYYLYRLATDPIESRDVAADFPGIFDAHLDAQRKWFSDTADWEPEVTLDWELEMTERLEALGYL